MSMIDRDTLVVDANGNATVEVTVNGETRRLDCRVRNLKPGETWLVVGSRWSESPLAGRYRTGENVWPASVTSRKPGLEDVEFGRDDRSTKFRKYNSVFWA